MTARERESAQDFASLAGELLSTKLSQSTAVLLLVKAVEHIGCLVNALGDQETELAHALHDPPKRPCTVCGQATAMACRSNLTHPVAIPICAQHSVMSSADDGSDLLDCIACMTSREISEVMPVGIAGFTADVIAGAGKVIGGVTGGTRPPGWVCSRCELRFPGRKPEDGLCAACEFLPGRAASAELECMEKHEGYRCNSDVGHNTVPEFDHAEWKPDGTIAARWPARRPEALRLAPVPDLADAGQVEAAELMPAGGSS